MTTQRNHSSADFKVKVALAAIKGKKTFNKLVAFMWFIKISLMDHCAFFGLKRSS
jgi:hypothetical protein